MYLVNFIFLPVKRILLHFFGLKKLEACLKFLSWKNLVENSFLLIWFLLNLREVLILLKIGKDKKLLKFFNILVLLK
jgi:hypothetical protein